MRKPKIFITGYLSFVGENGNQLKTIVGARTKDEWIEEIEEVLNR